ncbi:MAG: endolytic transglycosylase MltG [Candidatus Levybacteria bacterium]|nr:endolytic transglycosylase MltG [Candidatus Levybacteria bacterium]
MNKITITFLLIITISIGIFIWLQNGLDAINKKDATEKMFVIARGSSVRDIANNLKTEKFIKNNIVFFLLIKFKGLDKKIQAGDFRISPSMNALIIAETLTHGSIDIWITIPEGKRAEEIAEILKEKMLSYNPSWEVELKKNEGYLFPDTYLIPKLSNIDFIINKLTTTFDEKYSNLINPNRISREKAVIIASMIEREARLAEDRPIVSSVIQNRLNINMKLDIDATLQYVLGYQSEEKRWWKSELSNNDKKIESSYNTYKRIGLPFGPISNPGVSSLKAALQPATTDYFYYITDRNGKNRYAKTLSGHEANIEKYGL